MGFLFSSPKKVQPEPVDIEQVLSSRGMKKNPDYKEINEIKMKSLQNQRAQSVAVLPTNSISAKKPLVQEDDGWGSFREPLSNNSPQIQTKKINQTSQQAVTNSISQNPTNSVSLNQSPQTRQVEPESFNSNDYIDESEDEDLFEAVMASLHVQDNRTVMTQEEIEEDRRLLKEVMQLSRLEDQKSKGQLNLDHLKRNKASKMELTKEPPKIEEKKLQTSSSAATILPAVFQKKQGVLDPIQYQSTPELPRTDQKNKGKSLIVDQQSFGILPMSNLDQKDLEQMLEIEEMDDNFDNIKVNLPKALSKTNNETIEIDEAKDLPKVYNDQRSKSVLDDIDDEDFL